MAVTGGDTIKVLDGRREVKVRLYGIDSPEGGQAYGKKAKQCASDLAFGKTVLVEELDRDRYGRAVPWVILPDGRSLNMHAVSQCRTRRSRSSLLGADAARKIRGGTGSGEAGADIEVGLVSTAGQEVSYGVAWVE